MASRNKTVYVCASCGAETPNWAGKCPSCGEWNTLKEMSLDSKASRKATYSMNSYNEPKKLANLDLEEEIRFSTGISEFDRVLGNGAVCGSLILVGGAPGIGKSTLLLQMCGDIDSGKTVLYVSGEESERQLKLRAQRLHIHNDSLYVLSETSLDGILKAIEQQNPDIVIIDSIQTMYDSGTDSTPGSVSQIKECTMKLMRVTKDSGVTVFIVGHVNKEGNIAGPKILEHMVDCVLYFEGERNTSFRIVRAAKNRFGSTNEIGVFEMHDNGLACVENPSAMLLEGRPQNAPGTCVACIMEGTRPILAEIQALVTPGNYNPSRRSNGIDYNRVAMLLAVMEKRGGIPVVSCDAYINVIGGLELDETAADLATVLAVASSFLDRPLGSDIAAIGEVGLSGEIRSVSMLSQRLSEISRLGFTKCLIPYQKSNMIEMNGLELIPVKTISDAFKAVLGKNA